MAYSPTRVAEKRKACDFKLVSQRDGCYNCAFVTLKGYVQNRGKNFYCKKMSLPTPAYGICNQHEKEKKV